MFVLYGISKESFRGVYEDWSLIKYASILFSVVRLKRRKIRRNCMIWRYLKPLIIPKMYQT